MKRFILIILGIFLLTSCHSNSQSDVSGENTSSVTRSDQAFSAEEHMITLIKADLDALVEKDPDEMLETTGTIKNAIFNEIVALGEDALPLLELVADRSYEDINWFPDVKVEQRKWAVYAIYAIKPEIYDLSFNSPDGKYTVKLPVESFGSFFNHGRSFNDVQIIENASSNVVFATTMDKAFNIGGLFSPEVNWSADSKFAIIDCCGRRSGSVMAIDIEKKNHIVLPGKEDAINYAFPGKDVESLLLVPRCWFSFNGWKSDKVVKIEFFVSTIKDDKDFSGWYTYDLLKKKVLKMEYKFDNE